MNCLLLSTPDLRSTSYVDAISTYFDQILSPKLNGSEALCTNTFEADVQQLNHKILMDHHCAWFQTLPDASVLLKNSDYLQKLQSIVEQLGQQKFLVNDPMLTHFLPLWRPLVERSKVIFHYSEPMECAKALQKKWRFPIGFGLALWENTVLSASKNLMALDYTLVSSSKLRSEDESYLSSVLNEFGQSSLTKLKTKRNSQPGLAVAFDDYPSKHIMTVFNLLENNELSQIASMSLSESSADLIEYYGQLRFGYEKIKTERDQLQISVAQASIDDQSDSSTELQEQSIVDETLCKVKVYIDGMQAIEFYADPASPVLDMLRMNLANPQQDQLIYLNCGEDEDDTLYFMSSALLAMETEAVKAH